MKFVLYCEIPDVKKDQLKKCVSMIERLTPINVNNIFVTEDEIESNSVDNHNKIMHDKRTPHISRPVNIDPNRGWEEYDKVSNMPTL